MGCALNPRSLSYKASILRLGQLAVENQRLKLLLTFHPSGHSQIEYITHRSKDSLLYIATPRSECSYCV